MGIEELDQLGEVGKRSRQPVYLVDDDDVDLAGTDVVGCLAAKGASTSVSVSMRGKMATPR
jgi:hypothetical protein